MFVLQVQNGEVFQVIEEVALMVKAAGGADSPGKAAAISLLDCFDLEEELILVLERPVPSMDLHKYRRAKGGYLQENEAKIILKQMIHAAIEMHSNSDFHRDIKLQNVLVETGRTVPRVRVIDFGCGCLVKKRYYNYYCGTFSKSPPEWFLVREYQAIPTTVWQLGALLWDLLDRKHSFKTQVYFQEGLKINKNLSRGCRGFLQICLQNDPEMRPTLEQLQLHPWLR
ncbi:serine/threonine-protein kinase pim-2-like [Epinephelus fuscoguttatus]|uniref:serine/threonine-protein kinase pim-2-like n=1 Tax=Epinephelus fuscoguttatus TaxID=293821 RepID=UPI0020D026AE|nr:serine/threonine-protein kinase pim-2-like [Epinephelus fuscoguttatus]